MTKRKEKRINKSLLVNISQNGFERMGVTVNISRRGMLIATTEIFPVQSEFKILLAAADDIYSLTGLVVWNTDRMSPPGENVPAGLGVRIKRSDRGYARFIRTTASHPLLPPGERVEKTVS
ncbi:MAG: PilZ domain-containing protein [Candidatus Aminicenantes bacterium]|nr:PilZ domain-containing protein [Candidatus Aminicenantes bacterium]